MLNYVNQDHTISSTFGYYSFPHAEFFLSISLFLIAFRRVSPIIKSRKFVNNFLVIGIVSLLVYEVLIYNLNIHVVFKLFALVGILALNIVQPFSSDMIFKLFLKKRTYIVTGLLIGILKYMYSLYYLV